MNAFRTTLSLNSMIKTWDNKYYVLARIDDNGLVKLYDTAQNVYILITFIWAI